MTAEFDTILHPDINEILVYSDRQSAATAAAESIIREVNKNPKVAITFATGDTMIPVYSELAKAVVQRRVDFSRVTALHLDEYYPYASNRQHSFVKFLRERAFDPLMIPVSNRFTLDGTAINPQIAARKYDEIVRKYSDRISLLGIGPGKHIGFNEAGTSFESRTHLQVLSEETIRRDQVERNQDTPGTALTQGIGTILESKKLILVAFGEMKGNLLRESLYEPITEKSPASAIRLFNKEVTIIVDSDAGKRIQLQSS